LLRKLSFVGKPEPKKTESSVLVERHVNTFLKDVRLGVLTEDQMTTVLNALQAVVSK
jgi:hypothetical protein